jgi:uncharacterized protein DUF5681
MADSDNLPVPQSTPYSRPEPPVETRWKPGQSGNPGGRPKGLQRRVRELCGDDGDKIVTSIGYFAVLQLPGKKLVDAQTVAEALSVSRGWV